MKLPILLFFGIVEFARAAYKIPEHDACVLKVLLCDDFIKPLTPVDNSTLEMFESIGQLNAVCDELSKFRVCLKNAEAFCKENAELDVGFELLNNRRLAFDLCKRGSAHQHVYMMVEECVNNYSHSAIEFCTDKAVEIVGLEFLLGDYESECRFLGTMQHCHIAIVTDQCGSIAGNMLEKLVVYRGERDFMCIGYENERLKNLEAFYATMDSYVQQYKNKFYQIKTEDKVERVDEVESFKTSPQEASSQFHSRISSISDEHLPSDDEYTSTHDQPFNSEMPYSEFTSQSSIQHTSEQQSSEALSDENYACRTKASFYFVEIRPNGEHYQIGYGVADATWTTFSPLTDVSCTWTANNSAPLRFEKCSILIDDSLESIRSKLGNRFPFNTTLSVYENDGESARAKLRVHAFLPYSPALEGKLDTVSDYFQTHGHDVRFWCAEQHEANLNEEPNRTHSTNRIGIVQYDAHKYDMENDRSRIDQKYNFYKSDEPEYPVDTEIHLISSGEDLENEFQVQDNYASQTNDETLNSFLSNEIFKEMNYVGPSTPRPAMEPNPFHSYRPYELYRPRMGEVLEADHLTSNEDLEIENAEESNPNVLPKDASEKGCTSRVYAEEMCPALSENVSELDNKLGSYSVLNYMDIADPVESKRYKMLPISKTGKDVPLCNTILKDEEPAIDNKEMYVVMPSAEMEPSIVPKQTVTEDSDVKI